MKALFTICICFTLIFTWGCSNLTDSTRDKSVNMEVTLYGIQIETNDVTAAGTPTGKFGFGSIRYRSIPMEKGQPFMVQEEIGSLWGSATKTTIWVGRASDKSILSYEAVPNTMIKVEGTKISSGESSVNLIPETK